MTPLIVDYPVLHKVEHLDIKSRRSYFVADLFPLSVYTCETLVLVMNLEKFPNFLESCPNLTSLVLVMNFGLNFYLMALLTSS